MVFEKNEKVFEKGFEEALNDILGVNINERINGRIKRIKRAPLVRILTAGTHCHLCIFK